MKIKISTVSTYLALRFVLVIVLLPETPDMVSTWLVVLLECQLDGRLDLLPPIMNQVLLQHLWTQIRQFCSYLIRYFHSSLIHNGWVILVHKLSCGAARSLENFCHLCNRLPLTWSQIVGFGNATLSMRPFACFPSTVMVLHSTP